MKKFLILLFNGLYSLCFFGQNLQINYAGRFSGVIKQEKIKHTNVVCQLMPEFEHHCRTDAKTFTKLNDLLKLQHGNSCHLVFAQNNYLHTMADYENYIDYQSIEIFVNCKGITKSAINNQQVLSAKQKELLAMADLGSEIHVKIKFRFKDFVSEFDGDRDIKEADYTLTIIPDQEAAMPGGFERFSDFLSKNLLSAFPGKNNQAKMRQAVVRFFVNENGNISNPQMLQSSSDKKIDETILALINKMQPWLPAKNTDGKRVAESFTILFGNTGC